MTIMTPGASPTAFCPGPKHAEYGFPSEAPLIADPRYRSDRPAQRDPRQFRRAAEPQREAGPQRGAVVYADVARGDCCCVIAIE